MEVRRRQYCSNGVGRYRAEVLAYGYRGTRRLMHRIYLARSPVLSSTGIQRSGRDAGGGSYEAPGCNIAPSYYHVLVAPKHRVSTRRDMLLRRSRQHYSTQLVPDRL
eukprot:3933575-Rhodomonas_salina.8